MPRFFTQNITETHAIITGADAKHITKSLRMNIGEEIIISDLNGYDYTGIIEKAGSSNVLVKILERNKNNSEPGINIRLYQALPKADKLDMIAQKATELGAAEIIPVLTSFCVSRPDAKSMKNKTERLRKIAFEAAKQSGRGKIPEVRELLTFNEAVSSIGKDCVSVMFYEKASVLFKDIPCGEVKSINIIIGSEGGFSPEEAQLARENGVYLASLGSRILRCETAALAAITAVLCKYGEF